MGQFWYSTGNDTLAEGQVYAVEDININTVTLVLVDEDYNTPPVTLTVSTFNRLRADGCLLWCDEYQHRTNKLLHCYAHFFKTPMNLHMVQYVTTKCSHHTDFTRKFEKEWKPFKG